MKNLNRLGRRVAHEDAGMSLMEMIVGMLVMGIFMALFTGVILMMTNTVNSVQAVTTSATQVNTAFIKLDKLVRYADAITTVGQGSSGDWYVELDFVNNTTNAETCTQLRADRSTNQLQQRSWTATGAASYANLSNWTMLANQITNAAVANGSPDQPFTVPTAQAAASSGFQRLTITVVAAGVAPGKATTRSQMTFTALNSLVSAATNSTKCQQVGRP